MNSAEKNMPLQRRSSPMPVTPITPAQIDEVARLAEIPAVGSEERDFWLEAAVQHGFTAPDDDLALWLVSDNEILTLMSEARKQGQRDVLGASSEPTELLSKAEAAPHFRPTGEYFSRGPAVTERETEAPIYDAFARYVGDADERASDFRMFATGYHAAIQAQARGFSHKVDSQVWAAGRHLDATQTQQPKWLWFTYDGVDGVPKTHYSFGRWPKGAPGMAPYVRADIALGTEARSAETGTGSVEDEGPACKATPSINPPSPRKGQEENPCPMTVEEAKEVLDNLPTFGSARGYADLLRFSRQYAEASRIELAISTIRASEEDR